MTKAEIIAIGDEILIGQITNTNAQWIASEINSIGIKPIQFSSISDDGDTIKTSLDLALKRADVVFITGGLGPTKDDITKHTLTEYFNTKLVLNEERLTELKAFFKSRNYEFKPIQELQAHLPENCFVVHNAVGTACGMWFTTKGGKIVVSMPGVPYEMKHMMEHVIIPKLKDEVIQTPILDRTIRTFGKGESDIAEIIEEWENNLPSYIKLAYLPNIGSVRLRLSGSHQDKVHLEQEIDSQIKELYTLIPDIIFGEEDDELETVVGQLLIESGRTLSTAESCTGGYLAHKITSVSGSSSYFTGSIIAYSNEIKIRELNVPADIIEKHGAVSEEVVSAMAQNVKNKYKTDYALSCSGIAGPGGGSIEKPVGTVWIALATPNGVITKKMNFGNSRGRNIHLTTLKCLDLLRVEIKNS